LYVFVPNIVVNDSAIYIKRSFHSNATQYFISNPLYGIMSFCLTTNLIHIFLTLSAMSVESLSTTVILVNNTQLVVSINNHASTKLSVTNYPACKVQLKALLIAYDLVGYVDGIKTCTTSNHHDYNF